MDGLMDFLGPYGYFYKVYAGCNIKRSGWAKHVKTQKHIDGILHIETKHCWKCGCFEALEGFTEENGT